MERNRRIGIIVAAAVVILALAAWMLLADGEESESSGAPTSVPLQRSSTTAAPTTAPAPTTTHAPATTVAPTTVPADPFACGVEEAAIVAAAQGSLHLLTPGVSLTKCYRSAVDSTWAALDYEYQQGDALLLHYDGTSWAVVEGPPPPGDGFRQYYFFGCDAPPDVIAERMMSLC